jgi:hypothetical protein
MNPPPSENSRCSDRDRNPACPWNNWQQLQLLKNYLLFSNTNVHYRINKTPFLAQLNPVHSFKPCFLSDDVLLHYVDNIYIVPELSFRLTIPTTCSPYLRRLDCSETPASRQQLSRKQVIIALRYSAANFGHGTGYRTPSVLYTGFPVTWRTRFRHKTLSISIFTNSLVFLQPSKQYAQMFF